MLKIKISESVDTTCGVIEFLVPLHRILICSTAFVLYLVLLNTCWLVFEQHCDLKPPASRYPTKEETTQMHFTIVNQT
jgi:hypothetical protein